MIKFQRTPIGFITSEEGRRSIAYPDSRGIPTIGIGHKDVTLLIGVTTWSDTQIDSTFDADYTTAARSITLGLRAFAGLDVVRQAVLVSMAFQMGAVGTLQFHHMVAAVIAQRWVDAAQAMLSSDWHTQTPERCERAATMMRTGLWPDKFNGEA